MKQTSAERREFNEMIREEIESGNPFAEVSYRSYAARNRKKSAEKKEIIKPEVVIKLEFDEDLPF
jgi:hypothetical protein